jgi:transposase InsO family protein
MWGTDGTQVALRSGLLCWVFLAIDHCTAECIGVHASLSGSRFEALEPLRQGVREFLGPIDRGVASGLAIRHDHGSQYMSRAFQEEIAFLGMRSSPSYVGQPEGNGVAERFVRTLKEQLLWGRPSTPSRSCAKPCRPSARTTMTAGSSSGETGLSGSWKSGGWASPSSWPTFGTVWPLQTGQA